MRKFPISSRKFIPPQHLIRSRNQRLTPAPDVRSQSTKKLEDVVLKSMQIVQSQSYRQVHSGGEVIAYPSPTYDAMYAAILANNTARPMVLKKRDIAFREGINVEPNFAVKCMLCDTEYEKKIDKCEKCGAGVRYPDPDEESIAKQILKLKNANFQTLQDVLEEISVDHDVTDDGWLVSRNVYQELNGQIVDYEITEFWRVHPGNAAYSMSSAGRIGEFEYTCIYHRDNYSNDPFLKCAVCNRILHKVIAVRYKDQDIVMRYIEPEIYHGSEYNPTAIYGFPPALTMWYDLVLTAAQTKYMADYYVEKKWPSAALFVPAKQRKSAEAFRDRLDAEVNRDVQGRPVFRFDPDSKHKPEVLRMTDTPQEMEFIAVREESRMRMAAFWGISPIFNADVQASGGMNNESRQITVQSWATETKQRSMRKYYLDRICDNKGIQDWHFELGQIEEEDEAAEVQLDLLKAQYATTMVSMGFDVDLDDEGKPTKFEKMEQSQDPFGGMMQEEQQEQPQAPMMGDGGDAPSIPQTTMGELSGSQAVLQEGSKATKSINEYNEMSLGIPVLDEMPPQDIPYEEQEHYTFNYEYDNDWEWASDYDFVKFEDLIVYDLNVHPDFALHPEDVKNGSSRVRKDTLYYYAVETTEMRPLIVDVNHNMIDGHHRLYALMDKNQKHVRVAVVTPSDKGLKARGGGPRAPKGGVTINGKFYQGGRFIPAKEFYDNDKKEDVKEKTQGSIKEQFKKEREAMLEKHDDEMHELMSGDHTDDEVEDLRDMHRSKENHQKRNETMELKELYDRNTKENDSPKEKYSIDEKSELVSHISDSLHEAEGKWDNFMDTIEIIESYLTEETKDKISDLVDEGENPMDTIEEIMSDKDYEQLKEGIERDFGDKSDFDNSYDKVFNDLEEEHDTYSAIWDLLSQETRDKYDKDVDSGEIEDDFHENEGWFRREMSDKDHANIDKAVERYKETDGKTYHPEEKEDIISSLSDKYNKQIKKEANAELKLNVNRPVVQLLMDADPHHNDFARVMSDSNRDTDEYAIAKLFANEIETGNFKHKDGKMILQVTIPKDMHERLSGNNSEQASDTEPKKETPKVTKREVKNKLKEKLIDNIDESGREERRELNESRMVMFFKEMGNSALIENDVLTTELKDGKAILELYEIPRDEQIARTEKMVKRFHFKPEDVNITLEEDNKVHITLKSDLMPEYSTKADKKKKGHSTVQKCATKKNTAFRKEKKRWMTNDEFASALTACWGEYEGGSSETPKKEPEAKMKKVQGQWTSASDYEFGTIGKVTIPKELDFMRDDIMKMVSAIDQKREKISQMTQAEVRQNKITSTDFRLSLKAKPDVNFTMNQHDTKRLLGTCSYRGSSGWDLQLYEKNINRHADRQGNGGYEDLMRHTLGHEMAHMVNQNHSPNFKATMKELITSMGYRRKAKYNMNIHGGLEKIRSKDQERKAILVEKRKQKEEKKLRKIADTEAELKNIKSKLKEFGGVKKLDNGGFQLTPGSYRLTNNPTKKQKIVRNRLAYLVFMALGEKYDTTQTKDGKINILEAKPKGVEI